MLAVTDPVIDGRKHSSSRTAAVLSVIVEVTTTMQSTISDCRKVFCIESANPHAVKLFAARDVAELKRR
jgi:hypothetical protein